MFVVGEDSSGERQDGSQWPGIWRPQSKHERG